MKTNPEFRRNLWLEISPYRMVGMPAVLGAVFLLVAVVGREAYLQAMISASLTLFGALVLLWGTRLASEAVVNEVRDRTWDSQRMSSISPWEMTWGKLFGSTIYPWYGGILCLLFYAVLTFGDPKVNTAKIIAYFMVTGLLGQAVAMLVSLQAIKKARRYDRSQAAAFFVLGFFVSAPLLSFAFKPSEIKWFGMWFDGSAFMLVSVALFVCWVVLGINRSMRTELQMKNGPFVWLAFVLYISVYFAGLIKLPEETGFSRFAVAYIVSISLTYIMALTERKDPVSFRRLIASYKRGDLVRVLQELPCWTVTLLPAALASGGMLLSATPASLGVTATGSRIFILASFFFILRDLGLLLTFNFTRNPKRADMILLLALALLYGVIPGILSGLKLGSMTAFFWPMWNQWSFLSAIAAGAELLLVSVLMVKRWKALYRIASYDC